MRRIPYIRSSYRGGSSEEREAIERWHEKLRGGRLDRLAGLSDGLRRRLRATRQLWTPGIVADGRIDLPEPGASLTGELEVKGWAVFPSGPPVRVEGWLDDVSLGLARLGLPRPDVRRGVGTAAAGMSGFELAADLKAVGLKSAEPRLRVVATGADGKTLELGPVPVRLDEDRSDAEREAFLLDPPPRRTPRAPRRPGHRLVAFTHRLDLGGAQLYLVELIRELLRLEAANPTVVASVDGPLRTTLEQLEVPVHVTSPLPSYDRGAHLGRVEELTLWAEQHDFEIAMVNTASSYAFPGAEVAARLGIPALWAIHESFRPDVLWSDLDPEVMALARSALDKASLAVFEAASTMRLYEPLLPGRCLALPYGIDLENLDAERARLDPLETRRELGIPAEADVILCIGAIEPRKGQARLAQAFSSLAARHPAAHLVFVGGRSDQASAALEDYIQSCSCSERITLVPPSAEVQRWHGVADLLACPSDLESLPRVALEAMAWGKPVLATEIFGLPEIVIEGVTGWLCSPNDVEDLAAALERALTTTPAERAALGRAGRALVERDHAVDAYAEEFAGLLDGLAARPGGGSVPEVPAPAHANGNMPARASRVPS